MVLQHKSQQLPQQLPQRVNSYNTSTARRTEVVTGLAPALHAPFLSPHHNTIKPDQPGGFSVFCTLQKRWSSDMHRLHTDHSVLRVFEAISPGAKKKSGGYLTDSAVMQVYFASRKSCHWTMIDVLEFRLSRPNCALDKNCEDTKHSSGSQTLICHIPNSS
jgi:hypothetical protein